MIGQQGITSCCVGSLFFNFGGAHGVPLWKDYDAFEADIFQRSASEINVAVVTKGQMQTCEFLTKQGWVSGTPDKRMQVFTISGYDFTKAKVAYNKRMTEKRQEEVARKTAEMVARKAAAMASVPPPVPNPLGIPKYRNRVFLRDVRQLFPTDIWRAQLTRAQREGIRDRVYRLYGVTALQSMMMDPDTAFASVKTLVANRLKNERKSR